jgi:hypothetical protein
MILEARRCKYAHYAGRLIAVVFQAHPGVCGNKYQSSRMQIAFLVAHSNMGCAHLDEYNFILAKMFVRGYLVSRLKVFCHQDEMLRTILWADL